MCGIVGVLGDAAAAPILMEGLRRLEYRGYDSAGLATLDDARIDRRRAAGKLAALAQKLDAEPLAGVVGVGHTRWATHGAPTERNAHPHGTARVALVHNGIIENFAPLRARLSAAGATFESETDTEVFAQLIAHYLKDASPREAFARALGEVRGAFAAAAIVAGEDDLILAARRGSPLAVGHADGATYLGSDAYALAPFTNRVTYLEDGDWAALSRAGAEIFDAAGRSVERPVVVSSASAAQVDKAGHRHFMAKEIHEQPDVLGHTLARYLDPARGRLTDAADGLDFAGLDRLTISACGTAFFAALIAKYWLERWARLPVEIDIASELRYRDVVYAPGGAALFVSQSGETADTLAALEDAKAHGQKIAAIVNVPESSIARAAHVVFPTEAGPEIGVASTKAFTCQLATLAAVALAAGRARGVLSADDEAERVADLLAVPRLVAAALTAAPAIEETAKLIAKAQTVLYIGRGVSYPLALEGALKLKEISYIHAEGYAAGELKHGPIALIDKTVPTVVIAPHDAHFEKTISNMHEIMSREGRTVLITDAAGRAAASGAVDAVIEMPACPPALTPAVYAVAVQLLAYYTATRKGTDVDQPRNLAKSVTVE
ncbi:MAG: glutamine--fructose-6-phosphate transaminase (isomerizing) [Pseudomonadota bacterium]